MAKKAFEIQSSDLVIGGVNLQAGATSIVIPGVTQAANYSVEEVDETGEQTNTLNLPIVIDNVTHTVKVADAGASVSAYATYTAELDDEDYIDEIEVNTAGTYVGSEVDRNADFDMWGYTGSDAEGYLTNWVTGDWVQIPFRPKMRAGEVENVGGGGSLEDIQVNRDDEEGFTDLELADKDFNIRTTRSNPEQDADIGIYAADDLWLEAAGDDVVISAADEVRINSNNANSSYEWIFNASGHVQFPDGSVQVTAYTGGVDDKIWIETFASDQPSTDFVQTANSVEYDADGNVFALLSHYVPGDNSSYTSVAKLTPTGAILWQVRLAASLYTDGWGLAYYAVDNFVYVAGRTSGTPLSYELPILMKIQGNTGTVDWSKTYDFGADASSTVVDVASDGHPVMVGYGYNGTDNYIHTTKIDYADGSVMWSQKINGQGDEQAYGMAVGPTNEIVTVGYMDQYDERETYSVTPQTSSTTGVLVVNRSDLSDATFTNSWQVAGTNIEGYNGISQINAYNGLTGTVREGSGAAFDISVSEASTLATITTTDLATATAQGTTVINADNIVTPGGWGNWLVFPDGALRVTLEGLFTMNQVIPVQWGAGSTSPTGFIMIQFPGDGTFQITPVEEGGGNAVAGTWYFPVSFVTSGGITVTVTSGGNDYLAGHKIKIPYTSVGGLTTDSDIVLTVTGADAGAITSATATQTTAVAGTYTGVTGTNYQTGSGLTFDFFGDSGSTYTEHNTNIISGGTNYVLGDTITIPGTQLGGTTPENDLIATVNVDGGAVTQFMTFSGNQQTTTYRILVTDSVVDFSTGGEVTAVANWNGDQLGGWDQPSYTNLATTGGTGSGLTVDVVAGGGYIDINSITINNPGKGYTTGDVITINNENNFSGTFTITANALGAWTLNSVSTDNANRMLVTKYYSDGEPEWQKAVMFDAGFDCSGADADIDADGNIYVCGSYQYSYNGGTTSAMSLVKFNSSGVKQWSRRVVGDCDTFSTSVVVGDDGYLYLSGVTGNNNNGDYVWVIAKYDTNGVVVWQRLIDNTTTWTFGGGNWFASGGGSNIAVRNGYIALSGAFGDPGIQPIAVVLQLDTDATPFSVGDWDIKGASFSGLLDASASDIVVVNAGKTLTSITPTVADQSFTPDSSAFLTPTRYGVGSVTSSDLINGQYTLSLNDDGSISFPNQSTNNRTGTADALVFARGNGSQKAIATQNATVNDFTVERLVIAGGDSYYDANANEWFGEGGDIYLWAGKGGNGGDIKVDAGDAFGLNGDEGGTIKIRGGYSATGNGGFVEINGGYSPNQNGGDININGGQGLLTGGGVTIAGGYGTNAHGSIRLSTAGATKNWDFGTDGILTLPSDSYLESTNTDLKVGAQGTVTIRSNAATGETTKAWTFGTDGGITFPDTTVQTTAWAGGRVVSVPGTSIGAAGDTQGDIAFDGTYMYYCTGTFPTTYDVILYGGYSSNRFPSIPKGDYPQPQAGWTFVWNLVTYTVVAVTDPNDGQWQIEVDQTIDTQSGGTITFITATPGNIWKRVAWGNDTW